MTFDLLASITLTLSAAIVVTTLALALGHDSRSRLRITAVFAAWFAVVVALAATGALDNQHGVGLPGLGAAVLLPVLTMCGLMLLSPSWQRRLHAVPVSWLVGVNTVRIFGFMFLLLHAQERLPATFATVAGWGDILVGLAAVPIAWLVRHDSRAARPLVGLWNAAGLLDLVAAVILGAASSPGPLRMIHETPDSTLMTTLPWLLVPGFLVPLLMTTHIAVFHRLRGARVARTGATPRTAFGRGAVRTA